MKTHLLSFILFLLTQFAFSQESEVARLLDQKKQIEQEITFLQDSLAQIENKIILLQKSQKALSTTPNSGNMEEKGTREFSVSLDDLLANKKEGTSEGELPLKEENILNSSEDLEEFQDENGLQAVDLNISEVVEEKKAPAPTLRPNELLAKEKLSIRLRPDNKSQVILELEKNTIVWKIDEIGDYTLVCYNGTCGYVPGESVGKELEPEL